MVTLRIEHKVSDFAAWKGYFDNDPIGRERAGVRHHRIYRPTDDPHYVLIDLDFDSASAAEACLAALRNNVWRTPETSPALVGNSQTRIIEVAESKEY